MDGAVVLPSRGWASAFTVVNTTEYHLLGPWGPGVTLFELVCRYQVEGVAIIGFAAAVTPSPQANLESFATGWRLIQRGEAKLGGFPSVVFDHKAEAINQFVLPIGLTVSSGPLYVVVGATAAAAGIEANFLVTVSAVQELSGPVSAVPTF